MTVICALCDPATREVWLGCNSGSTVGQMRLPSASSKWLTFGDWAVAISGIGVTFDILKMSGEHFPGDTTSPLDVVRYLRAVFADFDHGSKDDGEVAMSYDLTSVLAHRDGRIWDMDFRLALDEVPPGTLWARGSGMEFALGADFPMRGTGAAAEDRVRNAVEAALFFDTGCPGEAIVTLLD